MFCLQVVKLCCYISLIYKYLLSRLVVLKINRFPYLVRFEYAPDTVGFLTEDLLDKGQDYANLFFTSN